MPAEKPIGALPAHDVKSCAGVLVVIFLLFVAACTRQPHYSEPVLKGPVVVVNIAGLRNGVPQFHSYNSLGHAVNFFIIKVDGKVLSFIDACMKCHPRRRGFRFDNGSVICRACDERFPVSEIAKGFGSCYPIKLEGQVHGEEYHIPATALEEMARRYFS
jgi:uncharacterized membrane protein